MDAFIIPEFPVKVDSSSISDFVSINLKVKYKRVLCSVCLVQNIRCYHVNVDRAEEIKLVLKKNQYLVSVT